MVLPVDHIEMGALETDSAFKDTYFVKDCTHFILMPAEELQRQNGEKLIIAETLIKKFLSKIQRKEQCLK